MFENMPPPPVIAAQVLVLFLGIGLHEYAHCKTADMAGDPTPSFYGRVTLNLTKHFEPAGTLMMIISSLSGFGIGWGRAAPVNPSKMRDPRWDDLVCAAAGPVSNLLQATIYAALLRGAMAIGMINPVPDGLFAEFAKAWFEYGVAINLALAIFNLIPFGPLDGHWVVGHLLPERIRYRWFRFHRQIGMGGLFITIILLQAGGIHLTTGPVSYMYRLLTGLSW